MGATKVECAERGWNLVTGCSPVSAGCLNCYAARQAATRLKHLPRYAGLASYSSGRGRWSGDVRVHRDLLAEPLFKRSRSTWFVAPRGDFFHDAVPADFLDEAFAVMNRAREQVFIIPTKRLDRALAYLNDPGRKTAILMAAATRVLVDGVPYCEALDMPWPLPNVILLASIEDQATADYRVPRLLQCNAAWCGVSAEPLLGDLVLEPWLQYPPLHDSGRYKMTFSVDEFRGLDWVIAGVESLPGLRAGRGAMLYATRVSALIDQCRDSDAAFFHKQSVIGGHVSRKPDEWPPELRVREYPELFGRECA